MKKTNTEYTLLLCSLIGFTLTACSFILMPFEGAGILPGILFWGGLLLGVTMQSLLEARRRVFFRHYKVRRQTVQKRRNGLLSFASNMEAKVADIALAVCFPATVLAFILTKGFGFICYILIAATVLAFCLHCVLNGRIYFHINHQEKIRRELEQKNAKTRKKGAGEK